MPGKAQLKKVNCSQSCLTCFSLKESFPQTLISDATGTPDRNTAWFSLPKTADGSFSVFSLTTIILTTKIFGKNYVSDHTNHPTTLADCCGFKSRQCLTDNWNNPPRIKKEWLSIERCPTGLMFEVAGEQIKESKDWFGLLIEKAKLLGTVDRKYKWKK